MIHSSPRSLVLRLCQLLGLAGALGSGPALDPAAAAARPNVIVILADDLGFSDLGCYGGEIPTPNVDRLAGGGVRFSAFCTSARCCPSRASLLTGLHPHQAGIGSFAHARQPPGQGLAYTGHLHPTCATLAEMLGDAGYSTWMVGKWHMGTPGPIDRGFQNYFGFADFLAHSESQWDPSKYVRLPEGTAPEIEVPEGGFFATDVFTEYALEFIRQARREEGRPFFVYLAHSAPHFPVQAPKASIESHVGKYRRGWDVLRAERFARQKALGLFPADAELPPRAEVPVDDEAIANGFSGQANPAWDSLPAARREDLTRRMATFAAMVAHVDTGIGRILDDLAVHGELDDTLVFFLSDNGACYEWGPFGFDGPSRKGTTTLHAGKALDGFGQDGTHSSYGSGWANLGNTPLAMYKHFCHEGGLASPLVVHWPAQVKRPGAWVDQPAHLMDIVPTVLEAAGIDYPVERGGHAITPVAGKSLLAAMTEGTPLPERPLAFEHQGARGLRMGDWKIVWGKRQPDPVRWELYNLAADRSEQTDLAGSEPAILGRLVAEWESWARRVGAAPFIIPEPGFEAGGRRRPSREAASPVIARRELAVTATVETGDAPRGVVLAQGGREQGFALHFDAGGHPVVDIRIDGRVTRLAHPDKPTGRVDLRATLDAAELALTAGGRRVSRDSPGLIPVQPKDPLDVGRDSLSAAGDYPDGGNPFSGKVVAHDVATTAPPSVDRPGRPGETGVALGASSMPAEPAGRWSAERAWEWFDGIAWPVGANFVPSSAINQLEMWQAETFDPETIDRELGWAAAIGMNTMRVYLHDIPWRTDADAFLDRIDRYLSIADRHGIRTLLVIFDGVWHPYPKAGPQPEPKPGLHNSGWVQSPGRPILEDPARHDELKPYVQALMRRFGDDRRVLAWDLFNEPDNPILNSYGADGTGEEMAHPVKVARATELLRKTFAWAREVGPSQPLTCGVWLGDYLGSPTPIQQLSLGESDVTSFHVYDGPERARELVEGLLELGRPVLCTEYMARGNGSTFEGVLPIFHRHKVGAWSWGLVDGKSQTIYPWDSWQKPYDREPDPWFHDVFRRDGTPYDPGEVRLIRQLAAQPPTRPHTPPPPESPDPRSVIESALASRDRAVFVKSGWIRDPFITLGPDGLYHLTGTTPLPDDPRQVEDPFNTGLGPLSVVGWKAQVWRSPDLVDWESLGTPFDLSDGIWAREQPARFEGGNRSDWRLWAPELHWLGERWALVHTSPSPVAGANLALTEGRGLDRPWTNPMGAAIGRRHDPSLFKDEDGTWWMIWGATRIAPLKPDFSGFAAEPTEIGPSGEQARMGHEGCLLHRIEGRYVLFGTGWSTGRMRRGSYNLYYATADRITGPYGERKFVGRFLGHGTPFRDKEGRWWCTAFFNANVPPLPREGIRARDLSHEAQTINRQGVTLVPLDVRVDHDGELVIRALDPDYATPGPDEAQDFGGS